MARLDAKFFKRHAGISWDPKTETREQGAQRGAQRLAKAFARAHAEGFTYEWQEEPEFDTDRSGIEHDYPLWHVALHAPDGEVVASLGGIDLVDNGPYSDPYARVVEAELAMEVGL